MKVKTSELIDAALDWAVAKCEGFKYELYEHNRKKWENGLYRPRHWQPSTDWAQGGPIIEREKISIRQWTNVPVVHAYMPFDGAEWSEDGASPLIAAMRCYVASKLGDEVDIPKELT